jgi:hypothetical protein
MSIPYSNQANKHTPGHHLQDQGARSGPRQGSEQIAENVRTVRTLRPDIANGAVVELRIPGIEGKGKPCTVSGYYNDALTVAAEAIKHNGRGEGVYITLQPIKPALLAPRPGIPKTFHTGQRRYPLCVAPSGCRCYQTCWHLFLRRGTPGRARADTAYQGIPAYPRMAGPHRGRQRQRRTRPLPGRLVQY